MLKEWKEERKEGRTDERRRGVIHIISLQKHYVVSPYLAENNSLELFPRKENAIGSNEVV